MMNKQLTIRAYNNFFGEEIDNLKQLKDLQFDGEGLHDFIEFFLNLHLPTKGEISSRAELYDDSTSEAIWGYIDGANFIKQKFINEKS